MAGILAAIRQHHVNEALGSQWMHEVASARTGTLDGWDGWSAECKSNWARQMLAMAQEDKFIDSIPANDQQWLAGVACGQS